MSAHSPLRIVTILLSILVLHALAMPADAQFLHAKIAVTGDPAPGRPGETFDRFNGLSLNDAAAVAIVAETAFNEGGVWVGDADGLDLVDDSSFNETVFLCDDGTLIRANAAEIVTYDAGTPTTVAAIGDPAPGVPDATFELLEMFTFHPSCQLLFRADLERPSPILVAASLWAYRGGSLSLVGLAGEPAPGLEPDYVYTQHSAFDHPHRAINEGGDAAFTARFELANPPPYPPWPPPELGLFIDRDGTTNLLYRQGDPVPGLTEGESFLAFSDPQFVQDDEIAFNAALDGPSVDSSNWLGIFRETPGGLELIARMGDQAAGQPASYVYAGLRDATLTGWRASFVGISNDDPNDPGTGVQRVWTGPDDDLTDIVSATWLADPPGAEGDTAIILRSTGNHRGRLVVHTADVRGDGFPEALWMAGDIHKRRIVGVGDVLEGRTIDTIIRYALNERAELAVHVGFDDDTEGIFLFTMAGDVDRDGDVDIADFSQFNLCFGGADNPPPPNCPPDLNVDFDNDGDVDLDDFAVFAQSFTGAL